MNWTTLQFGFILDLIDENNREVSNEEYIEANTEIIDKFF